MLVTGIAWEHLPGELGYGSGITRWRRLRDWNTAGVWDQLHQVLLSELREVDQLDWSRALVDSSHVRAIGGRTDRTEPGRPQPAGLRRPPRGWPNGTFLLPGPAPVPLAGLALRRAPSATDLADLEAPGRYDTLWPRLWQCFVAARTASAWGPAMRDVEQLTSRTRKPGSIPTTVSSIRLPP
jgi:hypothetical protein